VSESRFVGLVTVGLCDVMLGSVHLHSGGRGVGRLAHEDDQPAIPTPFVAIRDEGVSTG